MKALPPTSPPGPADAPASGSRRGFLASTLAGGAWVIGTGAMPLAHAQTAPPGAPTNATPRPPGFGAWLKFDPSGRVTALTNIAHLGQGTHRAIARLVADELAVPPDWVRVEPAPVEPRFANHTLHAYATFGSVGFTSSHATLAPVCAAARDLLIRAAAARWGVAPQHCTARDGRVEHRPAGGAAVRSAGYAELLPAAAALTPTDTPQPMAARDWTVLGRPAPAPAADVGPKLDGRAAYGIDVQRQGQWVAAVLHAPTFGGLLESVDSAPALAIRGVRQVVTLPGGLAVVADGWWAAHKGTLALRPRWRDGPRAAAGTYGHRRLLWLAVGDAVGRPMPAALSRRQDPDATARALAEAAHVVELGFEVPFLAHATLEPMNATAEVRDGSAEVWVSTQSPADVQRAVADALGLDPDAVTVHPQHCGGGFGRRLEPDVAVQAALIARAAGRPVKTIWSREADMRSGFCRPAMVARVRLALGADHRPTGLRVDMAGPSLLEYSGLTNAPAVEGFDWTLAMGWANRRYALPRLDLRWTRVDLGLPCGYWRSVGHSQNCFFLECTLDHAARHAGIDPLDYRRRLLAGNARALAFIDALAARSDWARPLPAGHFRGAALSEANGTLSGHVCEVQLTAPGRFRIVRVTAAIDPGVVADPASVEAQMMGGTLFGLSAALFGEITMTNGRIDQGNFDDHPVLRLGQTPPLDVLVLAGGDTPGGVGEEGPPSIAPALANALLAASGKQVVQLPLHRSGWRLET